MYGKHGGNGPFAKTDHAGFDIKTLADLHDLLNKGIRDIKFHTVPHVENLIHFPPACSGLFFNQCEKGRGREEVVLYNMQMIRKMEDLGLASSTAVDHSVDVLPVKVQDLFYYRSKGSGWR
jgi:hypothetical protein